MDAVSSRRSYSEMILEAIDELQDEQSSNRWAISGYIKGKYGVSLPPEHLARMASTGELVLYDNNYYRPDAHPAKPKTKGRRKRRKEPPFEEQTSRCTVVRPTEDLVFPSVQFEGPMERNVTT